jgi:large subunit ribosomal protein L9
MKVLLKHDVPKLGKAGQVKNVADGYARNYLIPHGVAVLATPGAMKQADALAKAEQLRQAQLAADASALAEVLRRTTLTFTARAGEGGKLYGSITSQQIADEPRRWPGWRWTNAKSNCVNRSGRWAHTKWPCIWRVSYSPS